MADIYFDNAATTKTAYEVADVMYKVMTENYANPSSLHAKGLKAEHAVKNARSTVAEKLKATSDEIVFTASGSEANNLALLGAAMRFRTKGEIITTKVEHKCVLECMKKLESEGFCVKYLDVDSDGVVDISALLNALSDKTQLVSIMSVNNECGSIQPICEMYDEVKKYNPEIIFHTDNVQGFCKNDITSKCCDMMSVSAHKIHGPKGVGALYVKKGVRLLPVIYGGGQEKGLRGGTENSPGIAGFGKAVEIFRSDSKKVAELKEFIKRRVTSEIRGVYINGSSERTSPYILNIAMLGLRSEIILHSLEQRGIFVSSGSACSSNRPSPSHVLMAMGYDQKRVDSSIRLSFNSRNTIEEANAFCDAFAEIAKINEKVRRL